MLPRSLRLWILCHIINIFETMDAMGDRNRRVNILSELQKLNSELDGEILLPGEPGFDEASRVKSLLFPNSPFALILPESSGNNVCMN